MQSLRRSTLKPKRQPGRLKESRPVAFRLRLAAGVARCKEKSFPVMSSKYAAV